MLTKLGEVDIVEIPPIARGNYELNWKKNSEEMDLCIKLEKITNRTFALNWKIFKKI